MSMLFTPLKLGRLTLPNRIIMPPMLRARAGQPGNVPTPLNAHYYAQRATAGLIVTEGSPVSPQGIGYSFSPGCYTDAQEVGWKAVAASVHAKGGRIALQLWHVGRISCCELQDGGQAPVAPSAIRAEKTSCFVADKGYVAVDPPRALSLIELPSVVAAYVMSATRAMRAGFDLVEIHAANGYLPNQFLATNSNQRSDNYGGSLENRARFLLEIVEAVGVAIGFERVGVRLSPGSTHGDIHDTEAESMALYLAKRFQQFKSAYLHLVDAAGIGEKPWSEGFAQAIREAYSGVIIICGGYDQAKAEQALLTKCVDAVAFGRPFIANPDLVARFKRGAPLNPPDPNTFYGGGEQGYTDYPTLA